MKWLDDLEAEFSRWLSSPGTLRAISTALRSLMPIANVGQRTVIAKYDDVVEVLENDRDFGVTEIYAARMARTSGPFFLGMENTSQYHREVEIARNGVRSDDFPRLAELVTSCARELLDAARARGGRLDAVGEFSRLIPLRLVERYFGVPGPDPQT